MSRRLPRRRSAFGPPESDDGLTGIRYSVLSSRALSLIERAGKVTACPSKPKTPSVRRQEPPKAATPSGECLAGLGLPRHHHVAHDRADVFLSSIPLAANFSYLF